MHSLEYNALLCLVAAAAGFLGALTGLGGGVLLTPVLTLLFGVDLRYAIGTTLVSVIATSSGAARRDVQAAWAKCATSPANRPRPSVQPTAVST